VIVALSKRRDARRAALATAIARGRRTPRDTVAQARGNQPLVCLWSRRGGARPRHNRASFVLCLGLLLALACGPPVRVRAADEPPTIAPFATAHLRIVGTISAQGQDRPVQGEGDVDATKGASRLTVTLLGTISETITIGGRTYRRNATTGRWEYTDGVGGGFDPARLALYDPATIRAGGKAFARVGAETIDGEATAHWRADADLVALLGALPGAGGGVVQLAGSTLNLWLDERDGRIRRLTLDAQGTATGGGITNAYRLALTVNYGQFDTDVAIIAPNGAVAATPGLGAATTPVAGVTGGVPVVAPVATLTPLGEATSDAGLLSATRLIRLVALLSLVVIGATVAVAVRRGGRRGGRGPAARSRR
jgi:hypothetical protein